MKAVIVRKPGGVETLEIVAAPRPEPGPDDLLIRNFAAGLNRADLLQRRGLYPPPPGDSEVLGLEFAGEVAGWGSGVKGFRKGERVFGLVGGGAYAEFLRVHHRMAVPIPDHLSFDAAAAIPEAFYTANESLFTLGKLSAREVVLIHAGASGVGSAALQLARAMGAEALATCGSEEKADLCRRLGASVALNYRERDFAVAVKELTEGRGVAVILDLVGAKHWEKNLECLAEGGRLLVVGLVGGSKVSVDLSLILRRRMQVMGTAMRSRSLRDKIEITERFSRDVLPLLEAKKVTAVLDKVYPLEDVRAAHERMEGNLNLGKIVLRL
jgi:putative PIG3 family NAD(P)H quinone oxidoreductase